MLMAIVGLIVITTKTRVLNMPVLPCEMIVISLVLHEHHIVFHRRASIHHIFYLLLGYHSKIIAKLDLVYLADFMHR